MPCLVSPSPGSLFPRNSNLVPERLPGQELPQVLRDERLGALRPPTSGVGADDTVIDLPQPGVFRQRLLREDVEGGAPNLPPDQRVVQRVLVDARPAAHVDHPRVPGQQGQPLLAERVLGALVAGQDHDQRVGGPEDIGNLVLADDLESVPDARPRRDAPDGGAQGDEPGRQLLGDVAEAPDGDAGVPQGGEAVGGPVGLGPAEVLGPDRAGLEVAHLVEAAGGVEEHAEGVLSDGVVVQAGPRAQGDGGVEAGGEYVVGAGGAGLDPFEILHAAGGVLEVGRGVGPDDEEFGVDEGLWDDLLDVVGVDGHGEALDRFDVEDEGVVSRLRGGDEELHVC